MNISDIGTRHGSTLAIGTVIAAIALLANLLLIANPGFYSHDEWQRYDFITAHGVHAYLAKYWVVWEGKTFATPVRPIGLIQQGLAALWMKSAPLVPHLVSAILHALVALAVFGTAMVAGLARRVAALAAVLFCVSPLGVLANGWTAASYDQWCVLFTLISLCATLLIMRGGATPGRLLALLLCSSAAILSKETAMMLPGAVAGCGFAANLLNNERIQWRRIAAVCLVAALPVVIYLVIRFPALQRSMAADAVSAYRPSMQNILPNVLGYLEYPFIPQLGDMVSIVNVSPWVRHVALLMHLILIAGLAWTVNLKAAIVYVFAYGVFLLPVLSIPNVGSHYLYASGVVLATALAWLLTMSGRQRVARAFVVFAALCVGTTVVHAYVMQTEIYHRGVCQDNFLKSLDKVMAARAHDSVVTIEWQGGTPGYIGSSAIFGRDPYQKVQLRPAPQDGSATPGSLVMEPGCTVSY